MNMETNSSAPDITPFFNGAGEITLAGISEEDWNSLISSTYNEIEDAVRAQHD